MGLSNAADLFVYSVYMDGFYPIYLNSFLCWSSVAGYTFCFVLVSPLVSNGDSGTYRVLVVRVQVTFLVN